MCLRIFSSYFSKINIYLNQSIKLWREIRSVDQFIFYLVIRKIMIIDKFNSYFKKKIPLGFSNYKSKLFN